MIYIQMIIKKLDFEQRVIEIRKTSNLSLSRNIGIVRCSIGGKEFEEFAVSGEKAYNGVGLPSQRIFQLLNPPPGHYRGYDSECKLLEHIAAKYTQNKNVEGKIKLFTERPPCPSCKDIISQFLRMFPNIEIDIQHR